MNDKPQTLPSTMAGLKKAAKKIKRETGCSHTEALNRMAQRMGYSNFNHARKELGDDGQP